MHNVTILVTQATQRYEQARSVFSEQVRKYYPNYDKLPSDIPKSILESYLWSTGTAAALSKITGGNSSHIFRYGIMGAVGCLIDVVLRNEINKGLPTLSSAPTPPTDFLQGSSQGDFSSISGNSDPNLVHTDGTRVKEQWLDDDSPEMLSRESSSEDSFSDEELTTSEFFSSSVLTEEPGKTSSSTENSPSVEIKLGVFADSLLMLKNPAFQKAVFRAVVVVTGLHILNVAFGDSVKVARVFVNVAGVLALTAYQTNQTFADNKVTPWPFL